MATLADIQSLIDNTLAQLVAVMSEKTTVLGYITALGSDKDVTSVSSTGDAGGEAYSMVSLNERLRTLAETERTLQKQIQDLNLMKSSMFPFRVSTIQRM